MKKTKTNISVVNNVGIRRNADVHIGDNGSFPSGDILDANATKLLVDNIADSVRAITDMAPEDFDTLKEAADAIVSLLSSIPTKVSDLENDVPYVTEGEIKFEGVDANGHEYVDLGLPSGTLWATCNVGANSSKLEGNIYSSSNVVDVESLWGGGWHVPTKEQWLELLNNTDYRYNNGYFTMTSLINGESITFYAHSQYSSYAYYLASSGLSIVLGANGVNSNFSGSNPGQVRLVLNRSLIDKYATKQELTAETQRVQTDVQNLLSSVSSILSIIDADPQDVDVAIDKFNEIVLFLNGIEPDSVLYDIINTHIDNGNSKVIKHVEVMTLAQYNALAVKDPNTEYNII